MISKLRIVTIALAGVVSFSILAGCNNGTSGDTVTNPNSTESPSKEVSSPSDATSPEPVFTMSEPNPDAQVTELQKDSTWIADSQLLSWPDPFPTWWTVDNFTDAQIESATKEVVTFTSLIGWNGSLMSPNTPPSLAKIAFAPYATSNALERFDKLSKGYLRTNKSIADGRNILTYFDKARTESEVNDLTDWLQMSSLMSFSVPYFVPFGGLRTYPNGQSNGSSQVTWSITDIQGATDGSGSLLITMQASRYLEVKGNPIFKDRDVIIHRDVTFQLLPNPVVTPGMPWLINDWESNALSDEETRKYFINGDDVNQGPVKEFAGF